MRTYLLASAAVLGLALTLPAFAQTATDPNPANPSAVQDGTPAAGTGSGAAPGKDPVAASKTGASLGANAPQGGPGPMGEQTNPAPTTPSSGSSMGSGASGTESSGAMAAPAAPGSDTSSGTSQPDTGTPAPRPHTMSSMQGSHHWAHQPGTGESGPASAQASNIDRADTRSVIAPHLPSPDLGENAGPERYLRVADRALRAHKTGEAQQALEMAETRLLDRSTAPSQANQPDQSPRVEAVNNALRALASRNWEGARKDIQEAMNRGGQGNAGGGMASEGAMGAGGMASGTTNGGSGTSSGGMGSTSTMAPNSTNQGVAGGNAGASPAPMDPSAQGPASPGAAGTPTPGASATAPNQMQPGSGAK
jgi:hypothetical protein